MALRGKKPEDRKQRLKLLLSGPAGVGKTRAAIQMPKPYIIDTEQGSVHYGEMIEKSGGAVYETTSASDIIAEVRSLLTDKHPFLTVVIDPITTVYDLALAEGERKVGTDWGRHYGYANELFKRLCNLLITLDMNVVITAHEKDDYETITDPKTGKAERVKTGVTFDGYKKLDYIFDLWLALRRQQKSAANSPRIAHVMKTRLEVEFPDQAEFPWTYEALAERFGKERIEKGVESITLASADQVSRMQFLLSRLADDEKKALKIDKALSEFDELADMPADRMSKGIALIELHLAKKEAA